MSKPNCPLCGKSDGVSLYGPSNHRFSSSWVCYCRNPYGSHFSGDDPRLSQADRAAAADGDSSASALSKSNAAAMRFNREGSES